MIEAEKIRQEIAEKLQGLMGRIEYSPQGIAQVNDAMSEIVRGLYNAGKIEVGKTNDITANGEIWLREDIPLDMLALIPTALPHKVCKFGKYRVIQGGGMIGYVDYAGPPEQDMESHTAYTGTKTTFKPVSMEKADGEMPVNERDAEDCRAYEEEQRDTIEACVYEVQKQMSLEQKYRHAILVLQAISQRSGGYKGGGHDEWSEAAAFGDCSTAAYRALKYLGEPTKMPNRSAAGSCAGKDADDGA